MTGKIVHVEDWYGCGEYFLFAILIDGEWEIDEAFAVVEKDFVSYGALSKVREWKELGVNFHFE